jgi:hypothetical protein
MNSFMLKPGEEKIIASTSRNFLRANVSLTRARNESSGRARSCLTPHENSLAADRTAICPKRGGISRPRQYVRRGAAHDRRLSPQRRAVWPALHGLSHRLCLATDVRRPGLADRWGRRRVLAGGLFGGVLFHRGDRLGSAGSRGGLLQFCFWHASRLALEKR